MLKLSILHLCTGSTPIYNISFVSTSLRLAKRVTEKCRRRNMFVTQYKILLNVYMHLLVRFRN